MLNSRPSRLAGHRAQAATPATRNDNPMTS